MDAYVEQSGPRLNPDVAKTDTRVYVKVGRNALLDVRPPVVHFGGYKIGEAARQVVQIVNVSSVTRRVVILPTTTPFFTVSCDKKGFVAPGMAEEVSITFSATEWRYYYDCLKVQSEDENLLVPIHAYPVMNEVFFPRRIDFGHCELGQRTSREVRLECRVPIQFEFELRIVKPAPEITVTPSRGIVPANDHVDVMVEFVPTHLVTTMMEVEVRMAQFNFQPFVCTITGCGAYGITRERLLSLEVAKDFGTDVPIQTAGMAVDVLVRTLKPSRAGGGAGGGDPYTRLLTQTRHQRSLLSGPHPAPTSPGNKPSTPPEEDVDGIKLPLKLSGHAVVSKILQQQPGKLRIRDLKDAIRNQKAERAKRQQEAASGKENRRQLHVLDDETVTPQLKALLFEAELRERAEADRAKEVKFGVSLGDDPMTIEEVEGVLAARVAAAGELEAAAQAEDRARDVARAGGPGERALHMAGEEELKGSSAPDWNEYKNNTWAMRAQVLERFVQAVRKVIFRHRIQVRLSAVQTYIRSVGETSLSAASAPSRASSRSPSPLPGRRPSSPVIPGPSRLRSRAGSPIPDRRLLGPSKNPRSRSPVAGAGKGGPGGGSDAAGDGFPELDRRSPLAAAVAALVDGGSEWVIARNAFPVYRAKDFREYAPVAVGEVEDFEAIEPMALKEPCRYKLMGYKPEVFPALRTYVPLMDHLPLLSGAEEEYSSAGPLCAPPDFTPSSQLPPSCIPGPPPPLRATAMLEPPSFLPLLPSWGRDWDRLIQPAEYPFHDSLASEAPSANSCLALAATPLLSDIWAPRRDQWDSLTQGSVPEPMTGPSPEDAMSDSESDGEGSNTARPRAQRGGRGGRDMAIEITAANLTPDALAKLFYIPGKTGPGEQVATSEGEALPDDRTRVSPLLTKEQPETAAVASRKEASMDTGTATTRGISRATTTLRGVDVAGTIAGRRPCVVRTPRQQKEDELEGILSSQRTQRFNQLQEGLREFNALVKDPRLKLLDFSA